MSPTVRSESRTVLRVFVSSPGDAETERDAVSAVIEDMNKNIAHKLAISLDVDRWEDFRPRTGFREDIERRLSAADLFVMIFARRYGEAATDSQVRSGTREEFEIASELREKHGKPELAVYFLDVADDDPMVIDPGPQFEEVLKFKEELSHRLFYRRYRTPELFELAFRRDLTEWIFDEWSKSTARATQSQARRRMEEFFRLGGEVPSATIVHPARQEHDERHLLPLMAAEDFHAIRKITECLQLAGCTKVTSCTDGQYADFADYHPLDNEVYICVFTNPPALESLRMLSACSFSLQTGEDRAIVWRGVDGTPIIVRSPLSRYLSIQKEKDPNTIYKNGRMGIDFAILARYREDDHHDSTSRVYAFGLRSLGTWGAAWFLEREIMRRATLPAQRDRYEVLLRVEFSGLSIRRVTDVSAKDQSFFDREMSEDFIRKRVGL